MTKTDEEIIKLFYHGGKMSETPRQAAIRLWRMAEENGIREGRKRKSLEIAEADAFNKANFTRLLKEREAEARADEQKIMENICKAHTKDAYAKGKADGKTLTLSEIYTGKTDTYKEAYKKGQADLIEKLTSDKTIVGLARYWYDCLITGDEGEAFLVFKNNPEIEKLQKDNAAFILQALCKKATSDEVATEVSADTSRRQILRNLTEASDVVASADATSRPFSAENVRSAEAKDAVGVHTLPHSEKSGLVGGASANSALSPSGATSHPTSCGKLSAPENALLKKKAENHNKKNHIKEGLNTPSKVKR